MADRPFGVSLACAFFGLVGLGTFVSGIGLRGRLGRVDLANAPESVKLFLTVMPFFAMVVGVLGVYAAVTLWRGSQRGRTSGLVWTALWAAQELFIGVWGMTGPDIVARASGGLEENVLRIVVAAILFYYLWTVGGRYVADEPTDASPSPVSSDA